MKKMLMKLEKYCLIDDKDLILLDSFRWVISSKGYVITNQKNGGALHRIITGAQKGDIVDHINGDKLDNRRSNLRICTNAQNLMNRGFNKNNKSGYKGVSFQKSANKWEAKIMVDKRSYYLGLFMTKEAAAKAYNIAAKKLHGEFAKLNIFQ